MRDLTWGEIGWLIGCLCLGIIIGLVVSGGF
jgi:hypothetical protein